MKKQLIAAFLAAVTTLGLSAGSFDLKKYIEDQFPENPNMKLAGVEMLDIVDVPERPGWKMGRFKVKIAVKGDMQDSPPAVLFYNEKENLIAPKIYDSRDGSDISVILRPKIKAEIYEKMNLVAGDKDAKHKVVLFSDPMCPFCKRIIWPYLNLATTNPKEIALYYVHFPLKIHTGADIISQAQEVLIKKGLVSQAMQLYNIKLKKAERGSPELIIQRIQTDLGASVTLAEIKDPKAIQAVQDNIKLARSLDVRGTPTVYLDGVLDVGMTRLAKLISMINKKKK